MTNKIKYEILKMTENEKIKYLKLPLRNQNEVF